jgi:hypothetical protein
VTSRTTTRARPTSSSERCSGKRTSPPAELTIVRSIFWAITRRRTCQCAPEKIAHNPNRSASLRPRSTPWRRRLVNPLSPGISFEHGVGPPCRAGAIARHEDHGRSARGAGRCVRRVRRSDRTLHRLTSFAPPQVGFDCCGSSPCSSASRTMVGVGHHRSNPRSAQTAAAAW